MSAEILLVFVRLALPHLLIRRADVLPIMGKSLGDDACGLSSDWPP